MSAKLPAHSVSSLPSHTVRVSKKARRVSLRVLPGKGLEVVLPLHADPACVPGVLLRHRVWIEKTLARMAEASHPSGDPAGDQVAEGAVGKRRIPAALYIKGGTELVRLVPVPGGMRAPYEVPAPPPACPPLFFEPPTSAGTLTHPPRERFLVVMGGAVTGRTVTAQGSARQDRLKVRLRDWIRAEAGRWLGPQLEEMSAALGLSFGSARFRFQRSRWGSCSVKGNINLNACLLFLPGRLARYILLHELCHLRQMNHGEAFWKLVFAADPDALAKDRAMRAAWRYVPGWIWEE